MTEVTFEQYWQYWAQHHHPTFVPAHLFEDATAPATRDNPELSPWRGAVAGLLHAVEARQVAAAMAESEVGRELDVSSSRTIEAILDDWCGTRTHPWPWPGPPPWVIGIVSELSELAGTYQAGFLRDELLSIAGRALEKGSAA